MTETADILCAPPVLEPGWAQFLMNRANGEQAHKKKHDYVLWVKIESVPAIRRHCECARCYRVHPSSITFVSNASRFECPSNSHVCTCEGSFIE